MLAYIESAALGYIIGNIQFAVIFSYLLHRDDVRHHGMMWRFESHRKIST